MQISVTDVDLQSFRLLQTDHLVPKLGPWPTAISLARVLVGVEVLLSMGFHLAMWISATRGHWLNLALAGLVAINMLAAARLLTRLRGQNCASPITVYLLWKILQEIIIVPVLVVFTFIMMEGYVKSWSSPDTAIRVLVLVWIYAAYSLFLIINLGRLARTLWKRKEDKRRNSFNSTVSFITPSLNTVIEDEDSHRPSNP